jgi:hypothetical protein
MRGIFLGDLVSLSKWICFHGLFIYYLLFLLASLTAYIVNFVRWVYDVRYNNTY